MTWLIDTIQGFPIALRIIADFFLIEWLVAMFLLPFVASNRLSRIMKLIERSVAENKQQSEELGNKFDIANLVMSDFWKYKREQEKDDA